MAFNTNKNILITSGLGGITSTSVSQIDFKWYDSGIGTSIFKPNAYDLRSTIFNWNLGNEPVLAFGGVGTINGQQYFVGPYIDYSGTFSGINSNSLIQIFPISGKIYSKQLNLSGPLYDTNNSLDWQINFSFYN